MNRFWNKVEKTEDCWNWIVGKTTFGHGRFHIDGKIYSPHRLVYEWEYGEMPKGMYICHHCDNPSCVKLEHLFLGTPSENLKDAYRKGRIPHLLTIARAHGEQNGLAKLTDEKVRQMRKEYAKGNTSYRKLAKEYGVSHPSAMDAIKRITWKHVT